MSNLLAESICPAEAPQSASRFVPATAAQSFREHVTSPTHKTIVSIRARPYIVCIRLKAGSRPAEKTGELGCGAGTKALLEHQRASLSLMAYRRAITNSN